MNAAADSMRAAGSSQVPRAAERVARVDWQGVGDELDARGCAVLPALLRPAECSALAGLYADDLRFRSRVVMSRHGYGRGEYRYFHYPLPALVAELRTVLYAALGPTANRWHECLRSEVRFPEDHAAFIARCHAAGQCRPTPLLLRYGADDYNCLHQDLYGNHVFPLQATVLLSSPQTEFTGGEFVLTEQRPRMQSRAHVVQLARGDAVIFATRHRPVRGMRGAYRVNVRHGVSRVQSGERFTLGVVFHDAK